VLTDAHGAVADPAGVIGEVVADQQRVELSDRLDLRDRDQVVAAEPSALTFDAALLVRALDAGVAVERLEAVVRLNATQRVDSVRVRPNSTRDTAALRLS